MKITKVSLGEKITVTVTKQEIWERFCNYSQHVGPIPSHGLEDYIAQLRQVSEALSESIDSSNEINRMFGNMTGELFPEFEDMLPETGPRPTFSIQIMNDFGQVIHTVPSEFIYW